MSTSSMPNFRFGWGFITFSFLNAQRGAAVVLSRNSPAVKGSVWRTVGQTSTTTHLPSW